MHLLLQSFIILLSLDSCMFHKLIARLIKLRSTVSKLRKHAMQPSCHDCDRALFEAPIEHEVKMPTVQGQGALDPLRGNHYENVSLLGASDKVSKGLAHYSPGVKAAGMAMSAVSTFLAPLRSLPRAKNTPLSVP